MPNNSINFNCKNKNEKRVKIIRNNILPFVRKIGKILIEVTYI